MSIFINVPSHIIDKYGTLFINRGEHIEFEYDYNVFKLYPMFDEDTNQNVFFHPCNISEMFKVYSRFFLENFEKDDYDLVYSS